MHGAAADDHRGDVDLGVHLGAVADDERVVALDFTLEHTVDADPAFEVKLALEAGAAAEKSGNFRGGKGIHAAPSGSSAGMAWQSLRDDRECVPMIDIG